MSQSTPSSLPSSTSLSSSSLSLPNHNSPLAPLALRMCGKLWGLLIFKVFVSRKQKRSYYMLIIIIHHPLPHHHEIDSQFFIRVILPSVCQLCTSSLPESGNLTFAFPQRQPPFPIMHSLITKLSQSRKKWARVKKYGPESQKMVQSHKNWSESKNMGHNHINWAKGTKKVSESHKEVQSQNIW